MGALSPEAQLVGKEPGDPSWLSLPSHCDSSRVQFCSGPQFPPFRVPLAHTEFVSIVLQGKEWSSLGYDSYPTVQSLRTLGTEKGRLCTSLEPVLGHLRGRSCAKIKVPFPGFSIQSFERGWPSSVLCVHTCVYTHALCVYTVPLCVCVCVCVRVQLAVSVSLCVTVSATVYVNQHMYDL